MEEATQAHYNNVLKDFYDTEMTQNSILRVNDEQTLRLIELYETERCLWDTTHEHYRSRKQRALAAERIARRLDLRHFEAKHVLIKFKNLRNSYCQELKKVAFSLHSPGPGQNPYRPRVFWFDKVDSFLRPHLQPTSECSQMYPLNDNQRLDEILQKKPHEKSETAISTKESLLISAETDLEGVGAEWPATPELEEVVIAPCEQSSDDEPLEKKRKTMARKKSSSNRSRRAEQTDKILRKVSECLEILSDRRMDMYEQFGKYVASLLRAMPWSRARTLQPQVVELLTRSEHDPAPAAAACSPSTTVSQSDQNL